MAKVILFINNICTHACSLIALNIVCTISPVLYMPSLSNVLRSTYSNHCDEYMILCVFVPFQKWETGCSAVLGNKDKLRCQFKN